MVVGAQQETAKRQTDTSVEKYLKGQTDPVLKFRRFGSLLTLGHFVDAFVIFVEGIFIRMLINSLAIN